MIVPANKSNKNECGNGIATRVFGSRGRRRRRCCAALSRRCDWRVIMPVNGFNFASDLASDGSRRAMTRQMTLAVRQRRAPQQRRGPNLGSTPLTRAPRSSRLASRPKKVGQLNVSSKESRSDRSLPIRYRHWVGTHYWPWLARRHGSLCAFHKKKWRVSLFCASGWCLRRAVCSRVDDLPWLT